MRNGNSLGLIVVLAWLPAIAVAQGGRGVQPRHRRHALPSGTSILSAVSRRPKTWCSCLEEIGCWPLRIAEAEALS